MAFSQSDVDALVTELTAAHDRILAKIAEAEAANNIDLSALKSEVDATAALVPDPSTTVTTDPVDTTAPVDGSTTVTDGSGTPDATAPAAS